MKAQMRQKIHGLRALGSASSTKTRPMLLTLSIQNIVVIDKVTLDFEKGLCVLSGETGAGKSILLDALSLALGGRADTSLIRQGESRAIVSAVFDVLQLTSLRQQLDTLGIPLDDILIIRRELNLEGPSRAFINDQPVSIATLRDVGNLLVDIHGQFDQLLEPEHHLKALDSFCGHGDDLRNLHQSYRLWQDKQQLLISTQETLKKAQEDQEYLSYAHGELCKINPLPNEDQELSAKRLHLMNWEKIHQALDEAREALENPPLDVQIGSALRLLSRAQDMDPTRITPIVESLARVDAELQETLALLNTSADGNVEPGQLESVDERLFALKGLARKHNVPLEELHLIKDKIAADLALLQNQTFHLSNLEAEAQKARQEFLTLSEKINTHRRTQAKSLDAQILKSLPDLKLDKATFETAFTDLAENHWGPRGTLSAEFTISTNPGTPPGSLRKIASGGERSRFMLALKTVLAQTHAIPTLVFDEADSGVGGATAAAIGTHLQGLSKSRQVLVITHSPQVAAKADHQWQILKCFEKNITTTTVTKLSPTQRQDEIARMLSGEKITQEARAAAQKLLEAC